jgi:hypothetical protein
MSQRLPCLPGSLFAIQHAGPYQLPLCGYPSHRHQPSRLLSSKYTLTKDFGVVSSFQGVESLLQPRERAHPRQKRTPPPSLSPLPSGNKHQASPAPLTIPCGFGSTVLGIDVTNALFQPLFANR